MLRRIADFVRCVWYAAALVLAAVPAHAQDQVLRRGNGAEPSSLDPHFVESSWETEIDDDLFLGLTTLDAAGRPIPGAAESWTTSEDGLTWTFTLRPGLVWSDGLPVTAEDFVFSLRRLLDPKTAARYASIQYPIKNALAVNEGRLPPAALGVHALDPSRLQITLETPTPYLPALMSHTTALPIPEHVYRRFGDAWVAPEHIVSDGAYTLEAHSPHDFVKLKKNPRFYDAAHVAIDTVIFYPIEDENVALTRFRAQEIDLNVTTSGFPIEELPWLQQNLPGAAHISLALITEYIAFNMRRGPFKDIRLRQAVSMCIDRSILAAKVARDGSAPAYALVPPGIANYTNAARLGFASWSAAERIARAKALLAAAGFDSAHPLRVDYMHMNGPRARREAVAEAAMLKDCGIIVHLIANEPKVHYQNIQEGDFVMAAALWGADYNDPQTFLYLLDSRSAGFNYGGYSNPKVDALIDQGKREMDLGKRAALLAQAEQIALDDAAIAPTLFVATRSLVAPYVKGFVDNPMALHPTRWMHLER